MRYTLFVLGVMFWLGFAYDIEYDRDMVTWMWLLASLYCFANSYVRYNHDKNIEE